MPEESRRSWMLWIFEKAGTGNKRNMGFQLWQQENYAMELFSNEFQQQKLDYIHQNPVVEGWVNEPEHYTYSSAIDYAGGTGLLLIEFIE